MKEFKAYIPEDFPKFMGLPCGHYDTVDLINHDGSQRKRVRAGDAFWGDGKIKEWRLSAIQGVPKTEAEGWGYYHDSTAPSAAQELGLDDKDFEFY